MATITNFDTFRRAKLASLEDEWSSLIERAVEFEKQGKMVFHHQLVDKAKKVRVEITKLRKSIPKKTLECPKVSPQSPTMSITIEPFLGLDHHKGYPRTPDVTPVP